MGFYIRVTLVVLFVVAVFVICEIECLDMKGKGVCVAKLSLRQSRMRSKKVIVTKRCGRKICKERKSIPQYYITWRTYAVCCKGWQHNGTLDICEPICSTGCIKGKCIAPDKCQCDPPFYHDPKRVNTCISNECNPACTNADCIENVCNCYSGFGKLNATHCIRCEEGYVVSQDSTCKPKCERECVNGTCSAPNRCTCSEGFKHKDDYTCQEICDCTNGNCSEKGICTCNDRYISFNSSYCIPKCDNCTNGECVALDECRCSPGYAKMNGSCSPVCSEPCVNGVCSAPDVCTCYMGYQKNSKKTNVCSKLCSDCKRVCDLQGICRPGTCVMNKP